MNPASGMEERFLLKIVAVIVHYGEQFRTIDAALSLMRTDIFALIVIVANDGSERPLELGDDRYIWLKPERNVGFGGACQLASDTYMADIYAYFNAHVRIDDKSVIDCMEALRIPGVGVAAPLVYRPSRANPSIDWRYAKGRYTFSNVVRLPVQKPLRRLRLSKASQLALIDSEWVTGAALFCRASVAKQIRWDGSYFISYEDVDLCVRARKGGWRVVVVPTAIAYHSGQSTRTFTASRYYGMRNALWFGRKFYGRTLRIVLTVYLVFALCRTAVADLVKARKPARARPAARGMLDGWLMCQESPEALVGEPLWSDSRKRQQKRMRRFPFTGGEAEAGSAARNRAALPPD